MQLLSGATFALLASPVLGLAPRYPQTVVDVTTAPANASATLGASNATTTGFPSTATKTLTTTVTAISHPPGTFLSLVSMITTRSETTYIPGPVTAYPATITETIISTGTFEHRRTSYNGKSTTLHGKSTATWQVTLTIEDPNPPPPDTSDFTFPYPFGDPTDTETAGDPYASYSDSATATDSNSTVTTPPATMTMPMPMATVTSPPNTV